MLWPPVRLLLSHPSQPARLASVVGGARGVCACLTSSGAMAATAFTAVSRLANRNCSAFSGLTPGLHVPRSGSRCVTMRGSCSLPLVGSGALFQSQCHRAARRRVSTSLTRISFSRGASGQSVRLCQGHRLFPLQGVRLALGRFSPFQTQQLWQQTSLPRLISCDSSLLVTMLRHPVSRRLLAAQRKTGSPTPTRGSLTCKWSEFSSPLPLSSGTPRTTCTKCNCLCWSHNS